VLAGGFDFLGVEGGGEDLFAVVGGLGEDAAEGVGDEGASPEVDTGVGERLEVSGLGWIWMGNFADGGRDAVEVFGDGAVGLLGAEEDVAELVADAIDGALAMAWARWMVCQASY